jgi:hypothetical protein
MSGAPSDLGGRRLALLLHHDDAERETAYDREFRLPLSEALDKAEDYGITVVSMKRSGRSSFDPFCEGPFPPLQWCGRSGQGSTSPRLWT